MPEDLTSRPDSLRIDLRHRDYWIFDMDGTLTVAMHDFDAIRADLGLPPGQPILETLAAMPADRSERLYRRLHEIESELAYRARAQQGAEALLEALWRRDARLGIVTRNSLEIAYETLRVCGLLRFFEPESVLGRDSAPPKPDPGGVYQLLALWDAAPSAAVMVGDYLFDLLAGRQAGTATVCVDVKGHGQWSEHADVMVRGLRELLVLATDRADAQGVADS